ncbi:hypothetical protein RKE29_30425, partial [Streptomyces sp. B1866]|nr:hypothetical protein [Streptomyces sp. B1866]
ARHGAAPGAGGGSGLPAVSGATGHGQGTYDPAAAYARAADSEGRGLPGGGERPDGGVPGGPDGVGGTSGPGGPGGPGVSDGGTGGVPAVPDGPDASRAHAPGTGPGTPPGDPNEPRPTGRRRAGPHPAEQPQGGAGGPAALAAPGTPAPGTPAHG